MLKFGKNQNSEKTQIRIPLEKIRLFFDRIGKWGLFKIMLLTGIIFISLIVFFFFNRNYSIVTLLGILSCVIEITMFLIWLKSSDLPVEQIMETKEITTQLREDMEEVKSYVLQEKEEEKRKRKLLRKLIEVGAVPEKEIYKLLRRNDVFCVYTYGEGVPDRMKKITGGRPPLIGLLEEMGFIRVASNQNLFVTFSNKLPPNLRDTYTLRNFIKKEIIIRWEEISRQMRKKYPRTRFKILEKWRTKEGFKASFIVMRCPGYDFIIDFLKKISFRPEFLEKILWGTDWNKLRKLFTRRKYRIKKFLSKISIEILLDDIPGKHRKTILESEEEIRSELKLKDFTDLRTPLIRENLVGILKKLLPNLDENVVKDYANNIARKSQDYYSLLEDFGISFD